jgi:DNA-binding response OmpR family regulator
LEAKGYTVETASTGTEAQAQLDAQPFAALILDWMLTGRGGLQILSGHRNAGDRTPVILLTARDAIGDRVLGRDCSAYGRAIIRGLCATP